MNALANVIPFNGQDTRQVSDKYPVLFTPAGYVFSIWSLIYAGLIAYAIYQALPAQRENPRLRSIRPWVLVNLLANSVWLLLFHYELLGVSVAVIVLILVSLVMIYLTLGVGRGTVSTAERWLVHAPFTLYMGWLTVATIANTTIWLYALQWSGLGLSAEVWAIVLLVVATIISVVLSVKNQDAVFILVPVWAFIGIAVKQAAYPSVATTALIMAGICAFVFLLTIVRIVRSSGSLVPRAT
jgi:hypothetical protein